MKKILTVFALLTFLGASVPAFAAPPPPPPNYGGQYIHAGSHYMRRPLHRHNYYGPHRNFSVYTNYYPHRLAFPHCRCPYCMAHRPQSSVGVYFSF